MGTGAHGRSSDWVCGRGVWRARLLGGIPFFFLFLFSFFFFWLPLADPGCWDRGTGGAGQRVSVSADDWGRVPGQGGLRV